MEKLKVEKQRKYSVESAAFEKPKNFVFLFFCIFVFLQFCISFSEKCLISMTKYRKFLCEKILLQI